MFIFFYIIYKNYLYLIVFYVLINMFYKIQIKMSLINKYLKSIILDIYKTCTL